jgi:hypothetical protein
MVSTVLDLSKYQYIDKQTVDIGGRRFYEISPSIAYPSITTILGNTLTEENKSWLNAWKARVGESEAAKKTRAATERGSNMHLMLERYMRNEDPKTNTFPIEHVKLFNSLKPMLRNITKVYGQEVVLYSHEIGVAGRCDLVGEYNGTPAIIDYKSSGKPKAREDIVDYWIQATFYALAHNEMFDTNIEQLVIMMGVENKLPMIFKQKLDIVSIEGLLSRTETFYNSL